jgi:hypothetical protein
VDKLYDAAVDGGHKPVCFSSGHDFSIQKVYGWLAAMLDRPEHAGSEFSVLEADSH